MNNILLLLLNCVEETTFIRLHKSVEETPFLRLHKSIQGTPHIRLLWYFVELNNLLK